MENLDLNKLDSSLFEFAHSEGPITDTKISTKRIGYLKDAFLRFCKNKASIVAAVIIGILFLYSIFGPIIGKSNYTEVRNDTFVQKYAKLLPKDKIFSNIGLWDGTQKEDVSKLTYARYLAYSYETKHDIVKAVYGEYDASDEHFYTIKYDTYSGLGMISLTVTPEEYADIQKYQDEHDVQLLYPIVDTTYYNKFKSNQLKQKALINNLNIWYQCDINGMPLADENGNYMPNYRVKGKDGYTSTKRIEGDTGNYRYAKPSGTSDWEVRVSLYDFFEYKYGTEPCFLFGTDGSGYDIFTRLSSGARISFLLAIFVSVINFVIGAIWGAISGYYGGTIDLVMERITDILSGIPFMVLTTLFQLHLASKVGPFVSLLFAFIATGWIGTAHLIRMQFYRYKNQEYVLAARTLGAKDPRIMFKHIFPNSLGTIITSSVLVIPGVIFGESSLTYLGIVNLESDSMSSVGTMLANGRVYLATVPHIIFFPALFISLLMISFNLFGNGLRDAFNPSLRGAEE